MEAVPNTKNGAVQTEKTSGYIEVPKTLRKKIALELCNTSGNANEVRCCNGECIHGQYNGTDVQLLLASGGCKSHYRVISFRRI